MPPNTRVMSENEKYEMIATLEAKRADITQ